MKKILMLLFVCVFCISLVSSATLHLTSGSTPLGGNLTYDWVRVESGAVININATGYLNITATEYIYMFGMIDGAGDSQTTNGLGSSGGPDDSTADCGGGGGSHNSSSGAGGNADGHTESCTGGAAGSTYDLYNNRTLLFGGSNGGTGTNGATGGKGGAGLRLAAHTIKINGTINISGTAGTNAPIVQCANGGGGGGSGGKLIIEGINVNISHANFISEGKDGGDGSIDGGCSGDFLYGAGGGGGGAGGIISIFHKEILLNTSITMSITAGSGGAKAEANGGTGYVGAAGTAGTYYNKTDLTLDFNLPPTLEANSTIPTTLSLGTTFSVINLTVSDSDNDAIDSIYFSVIRPNGTFVIEEINGTWILGNSVLGQNETWNSTHFNITTETNSVGTWTWNATIVSNGTYANTTVEDTFSITDTEFPSLNVTSITDNQVNLYNVSIPINFVVSDNVEVDMCWFSLNNGTSNTTIANCLNTTFNTNVGTYFIDVWSNDTSNNLNQSRFVNVTYFEDVTPPAVTIVSPTGTVTSRTITTTITATDTGRLQYCEFNITPSALWNETENVSIDLTTLSRVSTVSTDGDFVVNIFCNDTTGNVNHTSGTFTVDTTVASPPANGGGGAPIVVLVDGVPGWIVETEVGGNRYQFNLVQSSVKSKNLLFENVGTSSRTISLTCEFVSGPSDLCNHLEFDETTFELPLILDIKTGKKFTITIPSDMQKGDYLMNLVATDDLNNRGVITVEVNLETFSILYLIIAKMTLSKMIGNTPIPYFLIFMTIILLLGFGTHYTLFKPKKIAGGGFFSFLIGVVVASIIVIIL